MKIDEAICFMKAEIMRREIQFADAPKSYRDGKDDPRNSAFMVFNITEAMKMVLEAAEKQIPKKPLYGRKGLDDYVICPRCRFLGLEEFQPCCSECGQAIEW